MTINRNDPWYPNPFKKHDVYDEGVPCVVCDKCPHGVPGGCPACLGVTIRLKLAAMAMQGWLASFGPDDPGSESDTAEVVRAVVSFAFEHADDMIERANRDERSINGK